jgi:hypothetical protein
MLFQWPHIKEQTGVAQEITAPLSNKALQMTLVIAREDTFSFKDLACKVPVWLRGASILPPAHR